MAKTRINTNFLTGEKTMHRHSLDDLDGNLGDMTFYGADGKSAYDVAVDNGFSGTVIEWLDSLKAVPPTKHTVRFFDPFGSLLKTDLILTGGTVTAPPPPQFDLLSFYGWNHPLNNIERDTDIGGVYDTTDGKTYLFVEISEKTGYRPTIYLYKETAASLTIDWGDGTSDIISDEIATNITKNKATNYQNGKYIITLDSNGGYRLGQNSSVATIFGNNSNNNYTSILYKAYLGTKISFLYNNAFQDQYHLQNITLPSTVINLSYNLFRQCKSLKSITIPSSVVSSIAGYSFENCLSLESISLSPNMTSNIEEYAFSSLNSLKKIIIPSNINESIGASAFYYSYALEEIILPAYMSGTIGTQVFAECNSLKSLKLPDGITAISSYCFYKCYSLKEITLPSSMRGDIRTNLFSDCSGLKSITLPPLLNGVIATKAFNNCFSLSSLILPSTLQGSIEAQAFLNCYSLTSINIPNGITTLGVTVFSGCYALKTVQLSSNLAGSINTSAFLNCRALKSITIPAGITTISSPAFSNCYTIEEFIFLRTTPPTLASVNSFNPLPFWTRIYVPDSSVNAYKTATNWISYASQIFSINERP